MHLMSGGLHAAIAAKRWKLHRNLQSSVINDLDHCEKFENSHAKPSGWQDTSDL